MNQSITRPPSSRPIKPVAVIASVAMMAVLVPLALMSAASATPECWNTWGSLDKSSSGAGPDIGEVTGVRVGSHDCWDRVVVDLNADAPGFRVGYRDEVSAPGSGEAVAVDGGARLELIVEAPGYDDNGNAPIAQSELDGLRFTGRSTLRDVTLAGSFEGRTTFGIGVRARLPYRVFTLDGPGEGSRLVIDIAHRWPPEPDGNGPGFAREGATINVVGVSAGDRLNVRSSPGVGNPIAGRLSPTEAATLTGAEAMVGRHLWYELTMPSGVGGWSSARYLAYAGRTDDATAEYLAGRDPSVVGVDATMKRLGRKVAEFHASTEPASRIVMTVAPSSGDLSEVTYDVIGIGDDSVLGFRLHVFANKVDGSYRLKSIERTLLCDRGVDGGICV